jgi:hypothetical protein
MADITVRGPDGAIYTVPEAEYQTALDAGYTNVAQAEAEGARDRKIAEVGDDAAVTQGLLEASPDYDPHTAFAQKVGSGLTFGLAPGLNTPLARATGRRYQEEHPLAAMGGEALGQLPYALAGGAAGAAASAAVGGGALGLAADVGINAAVGGTQVEAEETRLSGEDFSYTDAAVAGLAGEVLGRGAAWGASKALGGARNLMARGERDLVAQDAERSLSKGGWVGDYRVAAHAEKYQNQLAELASRDLDTLEENFAEVSRQDRKRSRITRAVQDNPEAQDAIRVEAHQNLATLREALTDELGDATGPGKKLLKQLDDRLAALDDGRTGKKLWRTLDENRQALQEYRQDLYQSYESNPGSAWLSRDGLKAIDAAEKTTREALLREDAWGAEAAQMQREYNTPFHEQYFPAAKTVRGQLMDVPYKNAEGFPVYRGDPGKVRRFLTRAADDVDSHRLGEQFSSYLDGVEAIAHAGERDTPAAARATLESVRRLRKAVSNAAQITEAATRSASRKALVEAGADVAAGVAGAATFGVPGAVGFAGASRGVRVGHWLSRAAERLGWGAGEPLDMARLLEKDALPEAPAGAKDALLDDVLDVEPSVPPPPSSGPATPPSPPGGGPTPSMLADAQRGSWAPSEVPGSGVRATAAEGLDEPLEAPASLAPRDRPTTPVGEREVHRNQLPAMELEPLRETTAARRRDEARVKALTEGEFRDVVQQLRAVDAKTPTGESMADALSGRLSDLQKLGLVVAGVGAAAAVADDSPEGAAAAGVVGLGLLAGKNPFGTKTFRAQQLEKNLGSSRLLGAQFKAAGEAGQQEATALVKRAIEELPPPPPPRKSPDLMAWADRHTIGLGDSPFDDMVNKSRKALNNLDTDERRVLTDWVAGSKHVHSQQRTGLKLHEDDVDSSVFESAVEKLTVLNPTKYGDLHRFMDLEDTALAELLTKDDFVAGAHLSAGYVPDQNFGPHELRFTKMDSAGALIGLNPAESEMLVPKDARFRVTGRYANPETGNFTFTLEEVPATRAAEGLDVGYLTPAAVGLGAAGAASAASDESGGDGAAGAALAPLALFGHRASLFKAMRGRVVADVAKRLFSATAQPAARVAARLVYNRAQLKARQDEFQSWQENPQELVDRVAEGFRDVPPEHSGTVAGGVFRTATFLKERLPSAARTSAISLRQIPVSTEALAKFARYEQAALRPREALQEGASSGHLSAELMETLGELYPDLLAELRVGAIQQVRENGPPTTVQSKLSYARLFDGRGDLADPAFSANVASMTAYAYEQAVPVKPGGGPTSSGATSHVAAASAYPGATRVA